MQWHDEYCYLDVTEATEDNKVAITMNQLDDAYGYCLELELPDIVRLRDWLSEAIKDLQ